MIISSKDPPQAPAQRIIQGMVKEEDQAYMRPKKSPPLWTKQDIYLMIREAQLREKACQKWVAELGRMLGKYKTLRQMIRHNRYKCHEMACWWGYKVLGVVVSGASPYPYHLLWAIEENS